MAGAAAAGMAQGHAKAAADYAEEIEDLFGPTLALALCRRQELLACGERAPPGPAQLRRAWIAYPDYRAQADAPPLFSKAAKEPV
jgi:hypothetical protein